MFEIPWIKYSTTIDIYQHGKYLLKRKLLGSNIVYEIWKDGALDNNNMTYREFMSRAYNIINYNKNV